MPTSILALLVVLASLVALPIAIRTFWAGAALRREWTATSSLIFLSGMVGALPTALSNLIAPRSEEFDQFGNVKVGLTGWAAQLQVGLIAASLAAAALFFARRAGRVPVIGGPWIAIALAVVTVSADVANGHLAELSPRVLALLALLMAASVAESGRPAFLGAASVGLFFAFLGAVQAAIHPTDAFRTCRLDKCGLGGTLYVGAQTNENGLGLVLALTIPFVWLAGRGRGRIALVGYLAVLVGLTGSRTAQFAVAAGLLALVMLRPRLEPDQGLARGHGVLPVRQIVGTIGVLAVATVSALLPVLSWGGAADFGDRSYFWRLALDGIRESPLIGQGGTAWARLYQTSKIPIAGSYSPHNQWLDVGYAAGIVGLVLFAGLLGYLLLRAGPLLTASAAILIPVLVASALERPWSFAVNESLTFTLLAALLCVPKVPIRDPADDLLAQDPASLRGIAPLQRMP